MKSIILGKSVQGASHKRVAIDCQDSYKTIKFVDGTVVLAVADGHGSKSCPFSKTGSRIAVNAFCRIMSEFYKCYQSNHELLLTYFNREGDTKIAQSVDAEWKRRVLATHSKQKRDVPLNSDGEKNMVEIYKEYGTTLVGVMITPLFVFAFQIGDGDIIYVNDEGIEQVLVSEKILGTETNSLSKIDAWKKAITVVHRKDISDKLPSLFMLTTDGFANSYKNEEEFLKTCVDYFNTFKQYGTKVVDGNLKNWLNETSEHGCGDDITLLMTYFFDDLTVTAEGGAHTSECNQ